MKIPRTAFWMFYAILLGSVLVPVQASASMDAPQHYFTLPDPITLDFVQQSAQNARFLQVGVSFSVYDAKNLARVERSLPMLVNALRSILSTYSLDTLSRVEGRIALQDAALQHIQALMLEEFGDALVTQIYFHRFFWQ